MTAGGEKAYIITKHNGSFGFLGALFCVLVTPQRKLSYTHVFPWFFSSFVPLSTPQIVTMLLKATYVF
jgi:hypothetical protein